MYNIMVKQKMPDGWVRITWKDNDRKKWVVNIPMSAYASLQMRILEKGGVIIKEEY
jgi:hypothetical protein